MRRIVAIFLLVCLLAGCAGQRGMKKYEKAYFAAFDTYTTISGFAQSQQAWDAVADALYEQLWEYHQLFDIYNTYPGMNNLKTVNDQAGASPVEVDPRIIALLQDCKAYYEATNGLVNVAMGSVLRLWHDARTAGLADPQQAVLPDAAALEAAAKHTGWEHVIIDAEKATVYLEDPEMSLDVGAIAKGWATQKAAEHAPSGLLISVGGNVCATGPKLKDGEYEVSINE